MVENRDVEWPPLPGATEPKPEPEPPADDTPPPDDELAPVLRALVVATADVKPSRTDRRPKVTAEDASLVALCSLYGRTIGEAAREIGMSADAARSKLPRVKRAVFTSLASRHLQARHPEWGTSDAAAAGREED
jgi:DNA-directed RNA polymerase specialized sigma24 family protein